jgi:transposase
MHNLDVKYKAIVHYNHFMKSLRKVAKIYKISKSSLQRWVATSTGYKKTRKTKEICKQMETTINNTLKNNPFVTMESLSKICSKECGITRSRRTISRYAKRLQWTMKNVSRKVNYNYDNANIKAFCNSINTIGDGDAIFIDEAGFYVGDHPKKGRSKKGTKLTIETSKTVRRKKFTLIMAISSEKIISYQILDHNCKKTDFIAFIKQLEAPKGATLIMDNIPFHHSKETCAMMKERGFKSLYVPPYSPKMNAIENVFGVLKPMYRQRCPPKIDEHFDYKELFIDVITSFQKYNLKKFVDKIIRIANQTIASIENDNYFKYSGYD